MLEVLWSESLFCEAHKPLFAQATGAGSFCYMQWVLFLTDGESCRQVQSRPGAGPDTTELMEGLRKFQTAENEAKSWIPSHLQYRQLAPGTDTSIPEASGDM